MIKGRNLAAILALTVLMCILCGCVEDEVETPVSTPSSTPTLVPALRSTPTPLVTEEKNIEIVTGIVENYYKTHTYSEYDLFVCADMAIDVWNMVETQEINAKITVGNIDNPNANWTEYNHAWVLAGVSPDRWLALEPTGGYIVYAEDNENYYRGYFFENPKEFKKYLELMKEYNAQIDRINELQRKYSDTYDKWLKEYNYYKVLSNDYDSNCAGTTSDPSKVQECINKYAKLNQQNAVLSRINGELEQISDTIYEENKRLREIVNELTELLT
jgi:hypothetical protein